MMKADVLVQDEGTLVMFIPQTDAGRAFVAAELAEAIPFGRGVCVGHRYAANVIYGMGDAGLSLQMN